MDKNKNNELSVLELALKYGSIESKIPSIWPTYETAGIELAQDLLYHWSISHSELIRVIALLETRVVGLKLSQHIDNRFAFAGLYPHIMSPLNIKPE